MKCTVPRVTPNHVNYGPWVITRCQCSCINCNKFTILAGMLMVEKATHVWGQTACGKSFYLPLSFALNLRVL